MRFVVRWVIRLFILGVVLIVALVLLKDTILKGVAEHRLSAATGMDVRIGRFELGLGRPTVTIEDLKLYNTAEFGGSPFLDIPELHVEADVNGLTAQRIRLKLLRFALNEVNVVESKEGRTNIVELTQRLEKNQARETKGTGTNSTLGIQFDGIDTLNLTVGKVRFTSLRKPSSNTDFEVGLKNEIVTNVKSVEDLSGVLLKVIFRKGITIFSGGSATTSDAPAVSGRSGAAGTNAAPRLR